MNYLLETRMWLELLDLMGSKEKGLIAGRNRGEIQRNASSSPCSSF